MPLYATLQLKYRSLLELSERARRGERIMAVHKLVSNIDADILVLGQEQRETIEHLFPGGFADGWPEVNRIRKENEFLARSPQANAISLEPPGVVVAIEGDGVQGLLGVMPRRGHLVRRQSITVLHRERPIDTVELLLVGHCTGWVESSKVQPKADHSGVRSGNALDAIRVAVLQAFARACLQIAQEAQAEMSPDRRDFLREVIALMFPSRPFRIAFDKITKSKDVPRATVVKIYRWLYAGLQSSKDTAAFEQRLWRLTRSKTPTGDAIAIPVVKRAVRWSLAAVDILFPPGDEPHEFAQRALHPVPPLAELPLIERHDGRTLSLKEVREHVRRRHAVLYIEQRVSLDLGDRMVVVTDDVHREQLRRVLGQINMLNGSGVIDRERNRQALQAQPQKEQISLVAGQEALVTLRIQIDGEGHTSEGQVGLVHEHPNNPERTPRLSLVAHRERRRIADVTVEDRPFELVAAINDDGLALTFDNKGVRRGRIFDSVVSRCEDAVPQLIGALVSRWDELTPSVRGSAWSHVLDFLVARRPSTPDKWLDCTALDPMAAVVVRLPGFPVVGGELVSLAQLVESEQERGCIEALPPQGEDWPSPFGPERPIVCVDSYELSALRTLFTSVEWVLEQWPLWRERQRRQAQSRPQQLPRRDASLVVVDLPGPIIEGRLAIPTHETFLEVELCAEGRVVVSGPIRDVLPCQGSVSGQGVVPTETWDNAIFAHQAKPLLRTGAIELYRALGRWFQANPTDDRRRWAADLMSDQVVALRSKEREGTLDPALESLLTELRPLAVIPVGPGRRISLQTALEEQPAALGHLDLWDSSSHRLLQMYDLQDLMGELIDGEPALPHESTPPPSWVPRLPSTPPRTAHPQAPGTHAGGAPARRHPGRAEPRARSQPGAAHPRSPRAHRGEAALGSAAQAGGLCRCLGVRGQSRASGGGACPGRARRSGVAQLCVLGGLHRAQRVARGSDRHRRDALPRTHGPACRRRVIAWPQGSPMADPPQQRPVVRRSTNVIRQPPRQWFVDYLPVTGENEVELLVDGESYGQSLHAALMGAGEEVLLTGLHFQPTYRLLRGGGSADADLHHPDNLLNVLRAVAKKGVTIHLLVNQFWANEWTTSNPIRKAIKKAGHLDWYLPETFDLFRGLMQSNADHDYSEDDCKNVKCRTDVHQGVLMSTHHQKTVIIDQKTAFVGGIDLTLVDGDRWDKSDHVIPGAAPEMTTKDRIIEHWFTKDDVVADPVPEPYGPQDDRRYSLPEHFWHDVQCKVEGPAVQFVLDNFHARWNHGVLYTLKKEEKTKSHYVRRDKVLERREYKEVDYEAVQDDGSHTFERMALDPQTYQSRMNDQSSIHVRAEDPEDEGPPEVIDKCGIDSVPKLPGAKIQVVRSMPAGEYEHEKQKPHWNLSDEQWERSAKDAYLIGIRAAREYIYLENQWISDEHIWAELVASMRRNRDNPDFRIVIVLPRRPLDAAGYGTDQDIDLQPHVNRVIAQTASADQFGMYCLVAPLPDSRKENIDLSEEDAEEFGPDSAQIYVHSKVMIIDDQWSLIGSANAGGISLLGMTDLSRVFTTGRGSAPDTELAVVVHDKDFGKQFREALWEEHLEGDLPGSVPAAADKFREKAGAPDSRVQNMVLFQKAIDKGSEAMRRVPPLVMDAVRANTRIVPSEEGPVSLAPDSTVGFTLVAFKPGAYTLHYRWMLEDDAGQRWDLRALKTDRVTRHYGPEREVYIPTLTAERLRAQPPAGGQARVLCRVLVTPAGVTPRASGDDDEHYGTVVALPITLGR